MRGAIFALSILLVHQAAAQSDDAPRADECMAIAVMDAGLRAAAKLDPKARADIEAKRQNRAAQVAYCKGTNAWFDYPEPRTKEEFAALLILSHQVTRGYIEGLEQKAQCLPEKLQ